MSCSPGPWNIDKHGNVVDAAGKIIRVMGVALPSGFVEENDRAYANRNLVAAAPELLEALRDLRGYCERYVKKEINLNTYLAIAEVAIARAMGETP